MATLEERLKKAESAGEQLNKVIDAYAPSVGLAIRGIRFLVEKLRDKGVITPEEALVYLDEIERAQVNIDATQTIVDDYKRVRAAEKAAPPPA